MSEDKSDSSIVNDTIGAVTDLVKTIPIYDDAIQPAAKEIGKALKTVAKTINVALAPISGLVWGYDLIENFISTNVAKKLKNVPSDNIITPEITVAGPLLEALKYAGHKEVLREMYANLLATALNSDVAMLAHPSFVEVIRQLAPLEAELVKRLSEVKDYPDVVGFYHTNTNQHGFFNYKSSEQDEIISFIVTFGEKNNISSELSKTYLSNLLRLRILEIVDEVVAYDDLSRLSSESVENNNFSGHVDIAQQITLILRFSTFGEAFVSACINEK